MGTKNIEPRDVEELLMRAIATGTGAPSCELNTRKELLLYAIYCALSDNTVTQEQLASIAQAAAGILQPELNQLKDELSDNAEADAETRRKLDYLWKLNQGISYQFETDDAEAYKKNVQSGAKLASVQKIGGKTLVWNQLLSPQNYTKRKYHEINSDGSVTFLGITQNGNTRIFENITYLSNHKYLLSYDGQNSSVKFGGYLGASITSENGKSPVIVSATVDGADGNFGLSIENGEISGTYRFLLVDLTLMLGSGNEPTSTDDSRIAWIAQYAEANPEYNPGELVSADVESVKYNDAVIADIPSAVRALPGYGWSAGDVYNGIERTDEGWQYVQRVNCVDLGTLTFSLNNAVFLGSGIQDRKMQSEYYRKINAICAKYSAGTTNSMPQQEKEITFTKNSNVVRILDSSYTVAAAFKSAVAGVMLYYELAEPIITDITDMMADFPAHFEVAESGTITMENAAHLPVLSTEKYLIALAEVGQ